MLLGYSPTTQALLATLFTWGVTALGASLVFLVPRDLSYTTQRKVLDAALGFAAGVMLAASYWSLLAPALEFAENSGTYGAHSYVPVAIGLLLGAAFVWGADVLIPAEAGDAVAVLSAEAPGKKRDTETPQSAESDVPMLPRSNARKRNLSSNRILSKLDPNEVSVIDEMEAHRRSGSMSKKTKQSPQNGGRKQPSAIPENGVAENGIEAGQSLRERQQSWHRILLLVIAITVHNFPEGLAVGVGFGALSTIEPPSAPPVLDLQFGTVNETALAESVARYDHEYNSIFVEARNLAIGIGLQNAPEGLAVSLPLMRVGYTPLKAFMYGQLSGMVEPIAGMLGAFLVSYMQPLLPYALSFAAGAMIFVVVEDLIPETRAPGGYPTLASWFVMVGFVVMMSLDVGLG